MDGEMMMTVGVDTHTVANVAAVLDPQADCWKTKAFTRLCGAAPIPVSSGQIHRHRLHSGGDRQANSAL